MKRVLSLLLLMLATCPAWADVTIDGVKKIPQFGYAELSVKGYSTVAWKISPPPVQYKKYPDGCVRFGGVPGTTYTVDVTAVDFDKKLLDNATDLIVFDGPPPVDPVVPPVNPVVPPVDPVVPPLDPTDTLPGKLLAAFRADTDPAKAINVMQLAALYRQSVSTAKTTTAATVLALFQQVGNARDNMLPGDPLPAVPLARRLRGMMIPVSEAEFKRPFRDLCVVAIPRK